MSAPSSSQISCPKGRLSPGGVLGVLGGGQLGRMTALAAARLGIRTHIFTPEADSPASQVADRTTVADWTDTQALSAFAAAVDVITLEFENIPASCAETLAAVTPVHPGWKVLETAQNRITEKTFFNRIGAETAPWAAVHSVAELEEALGRIGRPAILKTTRLGYDGKGQARLGPDTDPAEAWESLRTDEAILEGFVDFAFEISVIVARGPDGATAVYPPARNAHEDGILRLSTAPAPGLSPALAEQAGALAKRAAEALDLVGLLAVELFVTADGHLLVNEMAPRPHNSGHWTMDGCACDQFEQLVRAVGGLPLGSTACLRPITMTNLIGAEADTWPALLAEPGAHLHLYGKMETREGRKMGHVNRPAPSPPAG